MKTSHGSVRFLLKQNGNVYCDTWGSPDTFRSPLCSEPCGLVVCSKEGFSSNVLRFVQSHPTLGTTPTSPQRPSSKAEPGHQLYMPWYGTVKLRPGTDPSRAAPQPLQHPSTAPEEDTGAGSRVWVPACPHGRPASSARLLETIAAIAMSQWMEDLPSLSSSAFQINNHLEI